MTDFLPVQQRLWDIAMCIIQSQVHDVQLICNLYSPDPRFQQLTALVSRLNTTCSNIDTEMNHHLNQLMTHPQSATACASLPTLMQHTGPDCGSACHVHRQFPRTSSQFLQSVREIENCKCHHDGVVDRPNVSQQQPSEANQTSETGSGSGAGAGSPPTVPAHLPDIPVVLQGVVLPPSPPPAPKLPRAPARRSTRKKQVTVRLSSYETPLHVSSGDALRFSISKKRSTSQYSDDNKSRLSSYRTPLHNSHGAPPAKRAKTTPFEHRPSTLADLVKLTDAVSQMPGLIAVYVNVLEQPVRVKAGGGGADSSGGGASGSRALAWVRQCWVPYDKNAAAGEIKYRSALSADDLQKIAENSAGASSEMYWPVAHLAALWPGQLHEDVNPVQQNEATCGVCEVLLRSRSAIHRWVANVRAIAAGGENGEGSPTAPGTTAQRYVVWEKHWLVDSIAVLHWAQCHAVYAVSDHAARVKAARHVVDLVKIHEEFLDKIIVVS